MFHVAAKPDAHDLIICHMTQYDFSVMYVDADRKVALIIELLMNPHNRNMVPHF